MEKESYDQAATVFSPDGRVYQVEYAREAIKRGGLAMGILFKDGILFTIDKTIFSPLVEEDNLEKYFRISGSIGAAASGLIADARVLIDILREKAQMEKLRYGEDPDIKTLVGWISKIYEVYTRYEGVRPFGTALIIGGKDDTGWHLFETDPSGVFHERYATAIGKNAKAALDVLEKEHRKDMAFDDAFALTIKILREALEEKPQDIIQGEEVHLLTSKGFERLDISSYMTRLEKGTATDSERTAGPPPVERHDMSLPQFLDSIPRLSKTAKDALASAFKDMDHLRKATLEELMTVKGVGRSTAERILKAIKGTQ